MSIIKTIKGWIRTGALMMALVLAFGMAAVSQPVYAAGNSAFTDISDESTATAAEILRLMGVVEGNGNGLFRPNSPLTRAQFCKMAIHLQLQEGKIGQYGTVTIFPDVAPNHWAYKYVNFAAKGETKMISGYPSGLFKPDQNIKADEAITILLRILGYSDDQLGVWPMGSMEKASEIGLLDGTGIALSAAESPISRGQAAKLFVRALSTEKANGSTMYTVGDKVTFLSIDGGKGTIITSGNAAGSKLYSGITESSLKGRSGRLIMNGETALTFIPETTVTAGIGGAAVIVGADGSTSGLSALAGTNNYKIYKNGIPATQADLKKFDVCIYSSETNAILVCDTRVSVFYEGCTPSPAAPTSITCLGGQSFSLLDSAVSSVAQFKPGDTFTLLLTPDGQVAGATTEAKGNAIGYYDGSLVMFLGAENFALTQDENGKISGNNIDGRVVRISQDKNHEISLTALNTGVSGGLDIENRTIGTTTIAENARFFDYGKQLSITDMPASLKESQLSFVHRNWRDEADVIQARIGEKTNEYYGRAAVSTEKYTDDEGVEHVDQTVKILTGLKGDKYPDVSYLDSGVASSYPFKTGQFYCVRVNSQHTFAFIDTMGKLNKVGSGNWIGKTAITYGASTFEVAEGIMCYVPATKTWLTLDDALAYSSTFNMYTYDGVVRVMEVAE